MGRTRILIAVVCVLLALGGAWWLQPGETGEPPARQEDPRAENGAPEDVLTSLGGSGGRSTSVATTEATWTVIALDADGVPVQDVSIAATRDDQTLTSTGPSDWKDVQAGEWDLVVMDGDGIRIERRVLVVAGRENRTIVNLGTQTSVRGSVQNSRGEALVAHLVTFLRQNETPPASAGELRKLASSATGVDGTFEVVLPEVGRWRPIVIYGGRIIYEGDSHELTRDGAPKRCDIVVPANPRVIVELADATEPVAGALSVYRQSTPLDLARDEEIERQRQRQIENARNFVEDDSPDRAEESARAAAGENDPERLALVQRQARWRTVVPEGWRSVASSAFPDSGRIVFDHLAHDVEHRLALRIGVEVFRVEPSVYAGYGEVLEVVLDPPTGEAPAERLRACPARIRPVEPAREGLKVGTTWH